MTTINIIKSDNKVSAETPYNKTYIKRVKEIGAKWDAKDKVWSCLLYTSDAADEQ